MKSNLVKLGAGSLLMMLSQVALAQGFAGEASNLLTNIRTGLIIIIGIVATIALVWTLAEGFMGKKTWPDVLSTCLWIFAAGAGSAGATWIFTSGQSISF